MMEIWINRWEATLGVAPRLSHFFSSPEARTFLREFKGCGNTLGDVEVLAFLLIFFVWPEPVLKRRPTPQQLTRTARSIEMCRRQVATLMDTGMLGPPEPVQQICDRLQQWATHLTLQARGWPMITMGRFLLGMPPAAAKRHRPKRQVVWFLVHYFRTLGCPTPPWQIITQFLILANLAPSKTLEKHIATWWSNTITREGARGGAETLASHQDTLLRLYEEIKTHVWAG